MPPFETDRECYAWVAAWIDAEGAICVRRGRHTDPRPHPRYTIYAGIKNTSREALRCLHEFTGGRLRLSQSKPGWKDSYELYISAQRCRALLPAVRPFLVIKGRQADLALEALAILAGHRPGVGRGGPAVWERLDEIFMEMKTLNARGRAPNEPVVPLLGGQRRGADSPTAKLTMQQARLIREQRAAGQTYPALAATYGVGRTTLRRIVAGHTYVEAQAQQQASLVEQARRDQV